MAAPGFFSADLPEAESFWLDAATARHVVQVLRMQPGGIIRLTNVAGVTAEAQVLETGKKGCLVQPGERTVDPEPVKHTTVAISLLKNTARFEWFLEKATELGIRRIIPLLCRRTEKQHFRRDRMQSILVSALIQSQQSWLPQLDDPMPFAVFAALQQAGAKGIGYCGEGNKMPLNRFPGLASLRCTLAIGPEGDFAEEEIAMATANGFTLISLGEQRLRTETAGLAAAVMMQQSRDQG